MNSASPHSPAPAPATDPAAVATRALPLVTLAGALAVAVGGAALVGWALDLTVLKSIRSDWVTMKPNTAVAFVLIGLAVMASRERLEVRGQRSEVRGFLSRLCRLLAGLLGLLSLAEYTFDWNPGFDQWLFPEPAGTVGTSHPGRMAPDTAICFALLAVGYEFARRVRESTSPRVAPFILGALVTTIGLVEILSYFTPSLRTYGWGGLTMMALPTAMLFTVLGVALVGSAVPRKTATPGGSAQPFTIAADETSRRFLLIFAGLAVGIITAGTFYYRNLERNFRTDAEHQLTAIAELKVSELTQYRLERMSDGSILFQNASFSTLVRRVQEKPEDAGVQRSLQDWLGKYEAHFRYDEVRLLNAQGVTLLSAPAGLPAVTAEVAEHAAEVQRSGQVMLQDFYRSSHDQQVCLAVLVPILDSADGHRPLGTVVLRIDPDAYLYPFLSRWPVPSATAETLLVRREGNEAVFLNELRFQKNTALTLRFSLANSTIPAVRAALGQEGIVEGPDYQGAPALAALRAVPDSPWFMVARRASSEVFAPLRTQLWQVIITVGVLLFGAGAGVGLVSRQQRVRFYRKEAESADALRLEKQNFEALFASSPVAMFILDETTQIVRVNAAAVALSGASSAAVLEHRPGNALGCIHSMEDPRGCGFATACRVCATRNGLESVLAKGGELKGVELQFELVRHGEIENVWMAVGAQPVLLNGRRHLIVAMEDITARKQAKERILHLNAELEQRVADRTAELAAANKELEAFSYSVSHDLRAPLRSIDGFSRIVLEDYAPKLDNEGRDNLGRIRVAAQRMGQLIDDMLNLSRVNRAELRREPVDLSALAREVAVELRRQEPARTVDLIVADGLAAEGDARLLRIVLENLLGNAWKFTGKCTAPRIEVGVVPLAQPSTLNAQPSTPTFYIRDNGAGFDPTYAAKLFGAFQRLHSHADFPGSGIGLATVQRIVHRHGGRIWADAQVGAGATFYFNLSTAT